MAPLRLFAISAILATSLAMVSRSSALADQPSMQTISFDITSPARILTRVCGIDVMREDVRNFTLFTYSDGTMLEVSTGPNYTIYTGPSGSLTVQVKGSIRIIPNPDGTETIIDEGNSSLNTVPGSGIAGGGAGRTVYIGTFNPFTLRVTSVISVISQTGTSPPADIAAICSALGD